MAIFPIMLIIVHIAFLSLGSNLGDKSLNLEQALSCLENEKQIKVLQKSSWLENPAIEEAGPHDFLNGVIKLETTYSPEELLKAVQRVELEIDSERTVRGRKYARMIDIDILIYDNLRIETEDLSIPHPRMLERDFVTGPLSEIEPDYASLYLRTTLTRS